MAKSHREDVKYSENHIWVRLERDEAVVGLTDYGIGKLGAPVHMEISQAGEMAEQDAPFGEIDGALSSADLISPLTGEVVEVNKDVTNNPELIREDPFEDGWLVRIRMDDPAELDALLTPQEYQEYIAEQEAEEKADSEDKDEEEEEDEGDEEE
jgi:glycine cleavage system H protein